MRTFFSGESCKEAPPNALNPQSWLQVERGKLPKLSPQSSSTSIESLIKVPQPPILQYFKPVDYVEVLAQIHEELESCAPQEQSNLFLLQYQIFRGLGDVKLMRRSIREAWQRASTVHEKIIFGAWLKYEKHGEEVIAGLLTSKCEKEYEPIDVESHLTFDTDVSSHERVLMNGKHSSQYVIFTIGNEKITCDRQKISELSAPFHAMLNGYFRESFSETIDLSENNISPSCMRAISYFSSTGSLLDAPPNLLLEMLVFANKYCCDRLKKACDRRLASLVSSKEDALELMECALDESSAVLAASCLQVLLRDVPGCLSDNQVVELFVTANRQRLAVMVGPGLFALFCFLSEVSMNLNSSSDTTAHFLERLVDFAENDKQKLLACHQLGCVRLLRKEFDEAQYLFQRAVNAGHIYSVAGLARLDCIKGEMLLANEKISSVISSVTPHGWMYQERSLYCDGDTRWKDLEEATKLDPTLVYPYMYRASTLMRMENSQGALAEINRILGFKLSLECLELRFLIYLGLENYKAALRDVQAILTLCPYYRMFEGRVAASQLRTLVREHVEHWTTADCWAQLYDCWSSVDDIESLSVIYQMLEKSDAAKGVLYFRQSLLLLRLNCPEAAMRSLQLAWKHASSEHERFVYEGWILYDTGHYEKGLQKAEESLGIKRSFEAYFLKAYALADSSLDSSCSSTVISLLEDALRCPSDNLRKGQALNNLGSVFVECGKLDEAADCYIKALKIRHTRAHQGLARVHFLKNDKTAAYKEMTNLIEKAKNNASAYEKRSEYGDREHTREDLETVTRLDPLRVYPYRYRAAVLMDNHKEEEAIAELSRAIAFKADLHLLHLRAAFHEHKGDVLGALRDCRAALSVDPNHQEMLDLHTRVNSHEP
ncbi:ETO1-like protein 1 isoform X1 [Lotus japonicus]|uniref:ETO1-like protein 1 isoform X1 n=1 Tax=Lotus japonicus TaxID=34305 RepID=UPI00258C701E|nr:ETO1-like protein 1 isoform X1 [Lotus japonicus]XP_057422880.1 ETO1-like protein 1 isoform X1 [Lotus japonicus]XP_057422881.1 ETO1-like protein 1 isoform X1 [Lotus japonicus]